MNAVDAVTLIAKRFPILRKRVDHPDDLFEMPHVTYGLLAAEMLENSDDDGFLARVASFVDELANSGDELLEELLVVDVLEGIAQSPGLSNRRRTRITPKAASFLESVEKEFFGRNRK